MGEDAAEEMITETRETELSSGIVEEVRRAVLVPERDMRVAAAAGEVDEGLGHEGGAQPVLLGERLHHELEEDVAVGGDDAVIIRPVYLRLPVADPLLSP